MNDFATVLLAGGFGKRLKSEWDGPKGLIELWGKTILWHTLAELEEMGVGRVVMVSNEQHRKLYEDYLAKSGLGVEVEIISDGATTAEHAVGALKDLQLGIAAVGRDEELLVLPCDTVTKGVFKLQDLIEFGQAHPEGMTVVARKMHDEEIEGKFGNLRTNGEGRLVEFVEKPKKAISPLAAAAIYYYPAGTSKWIEEYLVEGGNPESPGMIVPWLLAKGYPVYVYETAEGIMDVGTPEEMKWIKQQE